MKKLLPIAFAFLLSAKAQAQVEVGVTSAALFNTSNLTGFDNKAPLVTFSSGVILKINKGLFMFRPGINYVETGIINIRSVSAAYNVTDKIKINNFEIPLDVTYPVKVKNSKILFSIAPTITLALNGKTISEVSNAAGSSIPLSTNTTDIKFGNGINELKRLDFGSKFGVGFEFKDGIQINATIKTGFTNQSNANNVKFKTNYFALSASWFFLR